jgi:four helix bundle protein
MPENPQDIAERTFDFAVRAVRMCIKLDETRGVGRVLASQICRAGTAIGSQVEEAQAAESTADFISKLAVGLKEARETNYRLRVLAAAKAFSDGELPALVSESEELKRILGAIIVSTKRNQKTREPRRGTSF